jgi:hypothetical protein
MIYLECPRCSKRIAEQDDRAGGVGQCPACSQKFRIPGALEADAPPSEEILDALPGGEADDVLDAVPGEDELDEVEDDVFWRKKRRRRRKRVARVPMSETLREYDENAWTKDLLIGGGVVVLGLIVLITGGTLLVSLAQVPAKAMFGFLFCASPFLLLAGLAIALYLRR